MQGQNKFFIEEKENGKSSRSQRDAHVATENHNMAPSKDEGRG
jgi:hypothetical protein